MKKTLSWFALFILLFENFSFALDLQSALKLSNDALKTAISSTGSFVQWGNETTEDWIISILHEKGITIHTDWNSFKPSNDIRRDEAAKMLTLAVPYLCFLWWKCSLVWFEINYKGIMWKRFI